jgi:hypothetical protein
LNFVGSAPANKNGKHGTPESHARNNGEADRFFSLQNGSQPKTLVRMEAKMSALIAGMKDGQKEAVACQEMTEARLECKEPSPEEIEFEVECQEVPMEDAIVKLVRGRKKWQRG